MSRLKWVSGENQSPVDVGPVGQVGVQGEVGTAVIVYRYSKFFVAGMAGDAVQICWSFT